MESLCTAEVTDCKRLSKDPEMEINHTSSSHVLEGRRTSKKHICSKNLNSDILVNIHIYFTAVLYPSISLSRITVLI